MKKKLFIFSAILIALLAAACQPDQAPAASLTEDEVWMIVKDHIYFTKDGYTLRLDKANADQIGISDEQFSAVKNRIAQVNNDLNNNLERWGNKGSFYVIFPKERVIATGIDPKIILSDDVAGSTRSERRKSLGVLSVSTTINGGTGTSSGGIPEGTEIINLVGSTLCMGGVYTVTIDAAGSGGTYSGWFFMPLNKTITPGLVPGICNLYIYSTGCEASASAFFLGKEEEESLY